MYEFQTQTQGLHTFRVCTVSKQENIDTVGIGMLSNNILKGFLPLSQMNMDNNCILRYNISSKVTLQQFFVGKVSRKKIIKAFTGIVDTILLSEAYMLDVDLLLLKKEEIYINVSSGDVEMIYFPVLNAKESINVPLFLKTILFETEFDQSENCDYVTTLLNFLNRDGGCSLEELKIILSQISKDNDRKVTKVTPVEAPVVAIAQPVVSYMPPEMQISSKTVADIKEKKKGFSLFPKKKEKQKKIKPLKNPKQQAAYVPSMEIPGVKSQDMLQPSEPTAVEVITKAPIKERKEQGFQKSNMNFGETTVLHAAQAGETTVLGAEDQTILQAVSKPYLIRKKTGEKIYIDKAIFHLGKEKNYVDYCITDNSAISRSHADVLCNDNGYFVVDNNSLNHTFVNGVQITSQTQIMLEENSLLRLANEEFEFRI